MSKYWDLAGGKLYRCDVCGASGLWGIIVYDGKDRCRDCHHEYMRDKLISRDYREASGGVKNLGN